MRFMKPYFHLIGICASLLFYTKEVKAQANQSLSNLTSPTSVNQSLLPSSNNSLTLGNSTLGWSNIFMSNSLYLGSLPILQAPGSGLNTNWNLYIGLNAGGSAYTTPNYNIAIGYSALYNLNNSSTSANTALGWEALYKTTTGGSNTGIGFEAGSSTTTGTNNTSVGSEAGNSTTGSDNIAIGVGAGTATTGSGNITIGDNSYNTSLSATNSTILGYNMAATGSNLVRIGNTFVTSIGGQVGWTTLSDGRFKKNIKEDVQGLAFIKSLRPISYTLDINNLNALYKKGRPALPEENGQSKYVEENVGKASTIIYNGFIAQEVENSAKKLNFEFAGVDKPATEDGLYGLRYDNFVVPLVKAVQELSNLNDANMQKIDSLQQQIDELRSILLSKSQNNTSALAGASLDQNVPNPYSNATMIGYMLPQGVSSAQVQITDVTGKVLQIISVSGYGKNTLTLDMSRFSSGTYNYSLIADGRLIGTKTMVFAR